MRLNHTVVAILLLCAILFPALSHAQVAESIFWAQQRRHFDHEARIGKIDLYSSEASTVHPTDGFAIKLDGLNGKMYWSSGTAIKRSNLDGTNVEELITGLTYVQAIDLDITAGKLYFVDSENIDLPSQSAYLAQANLDGTSKKELYRAPIILLGLALDRARGKVYLSDYSTASIIRLNLDGSSPVTFPAGVSLPLGIALDSVNNKLYIGSENSSQIRYCDLDGTNGGVFSAGDVPVAIDVDSTYGKVYWIRTTGGIYRANLDGTNAELFSAAATAFGRGIALDFDRDGDGWSNTADVCYNDPKKVNPGACGCGIPDTDNDGDGTANCLDGCADDSRKFSAGICGCGAPDLDTNGNSVTDCLPEESVQLRASALKTQVDTFYKRSNSKKRQQVSRALTNLEKAVKTFPSSGTDVSKSALESATATASDNVKILVLLHAFKASQSKFNRASRKATQSITAVTGLLATAR